MVSVETKAELIERISGLADQVAARFEEEDPDERQHMLDRCSPRARKALHTLGVPSLHLLDAIPAAGEDGGSVNVVGLARAVGLPKGTVSKTVQRLADAGVVTRHRLPGNRKEVHLRLTSLGQEIQTAHRSLHEEMGGTFATFLGRYTKAELGVLLRMLDDLARMPRDGVRFRPDLLD